VVLLVLRLRLAGGYLCAFYSVDFPSFERSCLIEGVGFHDSQIEIGSYKVDLRHHHKSPDLSPLLYWASELPSALLLHMFDRTPPETTGLDGAQVILSLGQLPCLPVKTLHRPSRFEGEMASSQSRPGRVDKETLREGYGIHCDDRRNS
jgi:hypothetical protein